MHLKVITPKKIVLDQEVTVVTVPTVDGYISVLPRHANLFTLLSEGIIVIKTKQEEDYLAIGGGYLDTDGKHVHVLVSRAYNQNEIDEETTRRALERAQKVLVDVKETTDRREAAAIVRRSLLNLKLLKKRRPRPL